MGRRWAPIVLVVAAVAGGLATAGPVSAAVTATRTGDALTITDSGTTSSAVAVRCILARSSALEVEVDGASTLHGTCSTLRTVDVDLGGGADSLDTSGLVVMAAGRPAVPITVELASPLLGVCDGPCPVDTNSFTGGPLNEQVQATSSVGAQTLDTGGGDDVIVAPAIGSVTGGPGTDELRATGTTTLTATQVQRPAGGTTVPFAGIEQAALTGTAGPDTLDARAYPNRATLSGGGGDDVLRPAAVGDVLGGAGTDTVALTGGSLTVTDTTVTGGAAPRVLGAVERVEFTGGAGADVLDAAAFSGAVTAAGGAGADRLIAGAGGGLLSGEDGDDVLTPGAGVDTTNGGPGTDVLLAAASGAYTLTATTAAGERIESIEQAAITGGATPDTIDAAAFPGRATLAGGDGPDVLVPAAVGDVDGGPGADTLRLTGGSLAVSDTAVTGDLPRAIAGIERLEFTGGDGDDELNAAAYSGAVAATGGPGADRLTAGAGGATLTGGDGPDTLTTGAGTDAADGGAGTDTLIATAAGAFALTPGSAGPDAHANMEILTVRGSDGPDQIDVSAAPGPVTVSAAAGDDVLRGGAAGDTLDGGPGDDTLIGGGGSDALQGGDGSDTVSYAGPAAVIVDLAGAPSGIPGEGDVLAAIERAIGSSGADRLLGSGGPDTLLGGPGADHLDGRGGPDVLDGQGGPDVLTGGPGLAGDGDQLLGGPGFDVVDYQARTRPVRVTLDGVADDGDRGENDQADPGNEAVLGGAGDDVLVLAGPAAGRSLRQAARPGLRIAFGGPGKDVLQGSTGPDALGGGAGNDTLKSGDGNDAVHGGSGDDDLDTGAGNDRAYPQAGQDTVQTGDGDDVVFSLDKARDRVRCGAGADRVYAGLKDLPRPDCDRSTGSTKTAPPGKAPGAPGDAAPAVNEDATDCTMGDGDGVFCGDGGDAPGDADGDGVPALPADVVNDYGIVEDGFGEFDDFGAEFDDSFFGEGFDDFGDAFGEDLGGKEPPTPSLRTTRLRIAKSRMAVAVTCPKKVDRRCIGEVTAALPSGREVGTGLFAIRAGKRATVKVKLSRKGAAAVRKAKAKRLAMTLEGRDRGSALWQVTKTLKLTTPKKQAKKKR